MKSKWIALGVFLLSSQLSFAAGTELTVKVKGMVCGFCAQGIEKKFKAQSSVETVDVSLAEKTVKLILKKGEKIDDETVKTILNEAGYSVENVGRNKL